MQRQGDGRGGFASRGSFDDATPPRDGVAAKAARQPEWTRCDACGTGMQSLGHCKWLCRSCGFMRTCIDTV